MKTLILEAKVIENKNNYTIDRTITKEWGMKKPIMKKILYGVEIKKPTAYRIYKCENYSYRTWVFDNLEMNPNSSNVKKLAK